MRDPIRYPALLFAAAVAALAIAAVALAAGPESYSATIAINPRDPAGDDPITISVSGMWPDGCVPTYVSHSVVEQSIGIETHSNSFEPGMACIDVISPWNLSVEVGTLPTNTYTVSVYGAVNAQHRFSTGDWTTFLPYVVERELP